MCSYSILPSICIWAQVWNTSHLKGGQRQWDMRTALIIVISVKDKDNLSCADYRLLSFQSKLLKSFPTLSVVLNEIMFAFILLDENWLKIE